MPRRSTAKKKAPPLPVITVKVDSSLDQRLREAVKNSDTDISKFSRAALREKLDRMLA